MSKGSKGNNTGRSSGTRRAAVSVVRGGKAHPLDERAAREREAAAEQRQTSGQRGAGNAAAQGKAARSAGRGQYESDAQALADAWDPRKRAARQAREEAEAARAQAAAQDAASRKEDPAAKRAALRNIPEVVTKTPVVRVVTQNGVSGEGGSSRAKGALGRNPLAESLTLPAIAPEPDATSAPNTVVEPVVNATGGPAKSAADRPVGNAGPVEQDAGTRVPAVAKAASAQQVAATAPQELMENSEPVDHDQAQPDSSVGPASGTSEAAALGAQPTAQERQTPQSGEQVAGEPGDPSNERPDEQPEEAQDASEAAEQKRPSAAPRRRSASRPGADSDDVDEKAHRAAPVGKIIAIVILALVLVCAAVVGYAALSRWCWADDAGDMQGSWRLSGQKTSVVITQDTIDLADQVTYTYTLDTQAKVIDETLGKMTGTARYRFSEDRNSLAIFDDGSSDWWANALSDLEWYRDCLFARIRGEADPDLLHGESGIILYRQSTVAASSTNAAANVNAKATENANADNATDAAEAASAQDSTSSAAAESVAALTN